MELEDLKELWKSETDANLIQQEVDTTDLRILLKGQANNALDKIRRNMVLEGVFLVAALLFCAGMVAFQTDWLVRVMAGGSFFLLFPFAVFFTMNWLHIQHIQERSMDLKTTLTQFIQGIEQYLKVYFRGILVFSILSAPLGFLIGFCTDQDTAMVIRSLTRFWNNLESPILFTGIAFVIYGSIVIINYFVTKWWLQKLYGAYLEELELCLEELSATS